MSAVGRWEGRPAVRPLPSTGALLALLGAVALLVRPWPGYPFSAWMGAHLLLSFAAAPLLVLARRVQRPVAPLPAFVTLNTVTVLLHLPTVHGRLMTVPGGTVLAGALFLLSGIGLWQAARTRSPLRAAGLLGAQMAACALTGALVTFTRGAVYHTTDADVALSGVLMWVVGGLVPMAATLALLLTFLNGDRA